MIHFWNGASPWRLQAAILSGLTAALVLVSAASAVDLDFDVANGNYNVANNWVDQLGDPSASPPTIADNAFVRNNGTAVVDSDVSALLLRIGASKTIQIDDPENPGNPINVQVGLPGTLDWTAGEITGDPTIGPDIRVGQRDNGTDTNFTGTVNQNGATTKVSLPFGTSRITIGDNGSTPTPTSTYNLINGTIGLVIQSNNPASSGGSNGNNGINVRNGTFNMSGGAIIDETLPGALSDQRFMTISSASGTLGNENVSTATFSGGTVNVLGGLRAATSSHSRGFLNINGPVVMNVGGEISIGYNTTNGVGEMNMSDGQLTVGTPTNQKRLQIGHRGPGTLNLSGSGNISVSGDLRVGAETASSDSLVYLTGGTLTTRQMQMQLQPAPPMAATAKVIIDGPDAVFVQGPNGGTDTATIGMNGGALFEVRQGNATLHRVELGSSPNSNGVINLKGGKLKITGPVVKTQSAAASTVNLTDGTLEITPSAVGATTWAPDFINDGAEIILNPDTVQQVTVTDGSFAMNDGIWNIDIGSNVLNNGADRIIVSGSGTGSILGGLLNINHLSGYTPSIGDTLRIVRALTGGVALDAGAVTLAGDPNWRLITDVTNTEIQLQYVPEPTSLGLIGIGLLVAASSRRLRISGRQV